MYAQAMSSAKKGKKKFTLCWHISKFYFDFFHRAKPATEVKRSGTEVHCGVTGNAIKLPCKLPIKLARRSVVSASSAL